ncbi:MAG: hypothetical protein AAF749_00445 [Pseudomonadota bacterium]
MVLTRAYACDNPPESAYLMLSMSDYTSIIQPSKPGSQSPVQSRDQLSVRRVAMVYRVN